MECAVATVRKGARVLGDREVARPRAHNISCWLIYIGLILNLSNGTGIQCAPVVERRSSYDESRFQGQVADLINSRHSTVTDSSTNTMHVDVGTAAASTGYLNVGNRNSSGKDLFRNNSETDSLADENLPVLLLPDDIIQDNKETNRTDKTVVVMEYEPSFEIRCAAKGHPRPNVTWEFNGGSLPDYVTMTGLVTHSNQHADDEHSNIQPGGSAKELNNRQYPPDDDVSWVDLKLPKLNNAFYGRLRCRAENRHGSATWEIELIHNANSSMFMKLVRGTGACIMLLVGILLLKTVLWLKERQKEKMYEKLPAQDLEIINKFKKGLAPPPPSPSSSLAPSTGVVTGCVAAIEIKVTADDDGECAAVAKGYRPVRHELSSPDLQKRGGGASTPGSMASVHILDTINSWANYVPYDDKLETSSQHFKVDFAKIIENGSYGMIFAGKVRNDLTMQWSSVAVKTGKTERDDNFMLESILTELKILASLPKAHDHIVNLKGAYTNMLYKRQAYVFVDYCENGNLANYIDLNRQYFHDIFSQSGMEGKSDTGAGSSSTNNNLITVPTCITPKENGKSKDGIIGIIATFTVNGEGQPFPDVNESSQVAINICEPTAEAFNIKLMLAWAWQIADGMSFLHKNRIIHGNLNTENVYLTRKLSVKIGNIGYPPSESLAYIDDTTKKWLAIPHFAYETFSKRSDVWNYGRILWEVFSLRLQQCPDKRTVADFFRNQVDQSEDDEGIAVPDYATPDIFELLLCSWNENRTLCPEFDFFVKAFKQLSKEMFPPSASIPVTHPKAQQPLE